MKSHWHQFVHMLDLGIEGTFHEAKFVYLTRTDLLGQAISYAIAKQTGQWVSLQTRTATPSYSFQSIRHALADISRERFRWESFFFLNQIEPFRVTYEALASSPIKELELILGYLGASTEQMPNDVPQDRKRPAEAVLTV